MFKSVHSSIKFNGRQVVISDLCPTDVELQPLCLRDSNSKVEKYSFANVKMHVGNLIIGERYIEPQGKIVIKNEATGDECEIEYKARGNWFNNAN